MKRPVLSLAALLACSAQAEVYRTVGPDGSVTFTDQPVQGAEPVNLPPVSTYPAPRPAAVEPDVQAESETDAAQPYTRFFIASPAAEATIRDNQGNVPMRVQLVPPLQAERGHRIQFMVDGVDQGEPGTETGITFQSLDRGSHTLSARILDENGATLETTGPVTVFVLRASVLFPGRQQ
jgi:hypothetical protein